MDIDQIKCKLLDASHNFRGKTRESILKNSTYDRKMLIETIYSLIDIADKLLDSNNSENLKIEKIAKTFTEKTETLIKELIMKSDAGKTNNADEKNSPIEKHVLLVDNTDEDDKFSDESWTQVVKNSISKKLKKVPVNKTVLNKDGKGCIFLPDETSLNEAKQVLSSDYSVSKSNKKPNQLLPKMKINNLNVDDETTPEDLKTKILQKNQNIENTLKSKQHAVLEVLFIDRKNNNAVLKVSPDVREVIMLNKRIYVDLESHVVSDCFHAEQCYHCQGYGHRSNSDNCPRKNSDPVCFFCTGSHRSSTCRHKRNKNKQKCSNCAKSNSHDIKMRANTHNANSKQCPVYLKEIEKVKNKICYDTKNYHHIVVKN